MDLSLDLPGDFLYVRRVDATTVTVADRTLERSFLLTPERLIEDWPPVDATGLRAEDAEPLLALAPDVVVLGSGAMQRFPPAAFLAAFLRRGIGVEVMDNGAAARTYDLLAGERRRVLAAFILPAAASGHAD